jgi:hypothetical protein
MLGALEAMLSMIRLVQCVAVVDDDDGDDDNENAVDDVTSVDDASALPQSSARLARALRRHFLRDIEKHVVSRFPLVRCIVR